MTSSSNLDELLKELRERAKHNHIRPDFKAKPDSEPLIIDAILRLADLIETLEKRVRVLDDRVSMTHGAKRVHTEHI